MSTLVPILASSRREVAIAWCERRIARYELELEQPAPPVDAVIAHRAIVSAEIAEQRRRFELLRRRHDTGRLEPETTTFRREFPDDRIKFGGIAAAH